jgi:hypothetical protein
LCFFFFGLESRSENPRQVPSNANKKQQQQKAYVEKFWVDDVDESFEGC